MDIVFATGNANKVREIREILEGVKINGEQVEVYSMKDKNINIDIEENGKTFAENAMIKAKAVAGVLPEAIVMADDSGLEVDYINKEPGIYSARYMGEDTSYHIKNNNIIERIKDAVGEERSARFVCAMAAVLPDGRELLSVKNMEGRIAYEERGENGFGFDPIFLVPPYEQTSAELSPEDKNAISHRGQALRDMKRLLEEAYR
ncbi:MAG: RdgB/HAM1 family non-canonical purine NTP pyrophosphatase [Lachnospiraceae bacterium]|nr:RdgB/HAM1 family non-canonical purine NTP pyrophosphatase [Lachnospiraceae bacterium]